MFSVKNLFSKTVLLFCIFLLSFSSSVQAQTTVFKSGSAIIDMGGAGTPTVANSLKPYGLIYALLNGYSVPVYGVIGQTKVKDGIDFTYGSKSYKGGTYVISSEFLSPDVKTLLNSWAAQGVIIDYTTSDLTVNVTYKISFAPKWVMDKTNGNIAVTYLTSAGIPASAYSFKEPSQLGDCDDIFVLPHASPSWNTHNNLYFFNKNKGAIYVSCSAGSALEALFKDTTINGVAQRIQMNFLTTTGLVPASTHKAAVTPFIHQYPTDPIAQYMGISDAAQLRGAEVVYLPKKGGAWNSSAKIITKSPTQPDIPTLSDGPAAVNVYGRGFDDPTRGYVFYEAAHSVSGTTPEFIAAQRMFFNFSFFALGERSKSSFTVTLNNNATPAVSTVPSQMRGTVAATGLTATVSIPGTYKYEWKSSVPGTFSPSATISSTTLTATTVTFTPADVNSNTQAVITCVVTDANCSRSAFDSKGTEVVPSRPTLNSAALTYSAKSDCANNTLAINVFQDVVDANAGSRTLTVTTSPSNGTITVDASAGTINYTPNANFQGTETLNYTISNGGISSPASNTITINVGNATIAPKLTNDTYTGILENQLTTLRVLDNDKDNSSTTSNTKLFIREIVTKPVKGYVYINSDKTLTYVSKKNTSVADYTESFTYKACNDQGYCSIATVSVSVIDCGCGTDLYKTGVSTSGTSGTLTLTATADSYISGSNTSTKYGSTSELFLTSNTNSKSRNNILLKFDLSTIPSGVTINSAMLNLYLSSSANLSANSPVPASIFPVKKNWIEADVTWEKYSSSKSWSSSGALSSSNDYQGSVTALNLPSPGSSTYSAGTQLQLDLKSFVNSWLSSSYSNYGVIIFPKYSTSSSSTTLKLGSKENANTAYRPSLVVNYGSSGTTFNCISIPTNYKPIAYLDNVTTPSNTTLTISPLSNDANYYGRTNTLTTVGTPAHGTATISGTSIRYVPNGSFVGVDTLYYTISDASNSTTSTATVIIDVTRVAPKINRDDATTPSATNILINVAANDTDPQGSIDVPVISTTPKYGAAKINGNSISYTPNVGYVGKDTLIYTRYSAADTGSCSLPLSDTALVVITITNRAPIVANDNITATSCKPIEMDLLANDSDPEGTPLTIFIVNNPAHGTISIDEYGKYKYTSAANYVGSDQFTYYVKDGSSDQLSSSNATVNITVNASGTNNAPSAVNDTDNTVINQDVSTDVIANDSDQDGDAISINITAAGLQVPAHGTIQLLGNGQISYTPNANFTGTDTYQYQLCDNNVSCSGSNGSLCTIGTVTITIKALPILISGTVWNDVDKSASSFSNIRTNAEVGSNAFNGLYAHLVDGNSNVLDQAPIAFDGTYIFTNAPSNATNLKIVINSQLYALGSIVSVGSLPSGFAATTPSITSSFSTSTANLTGQDFGINQLPTANSFTFAEQTNPAPSSLTVNTAKISGTDPDGTITGYRFTSFPTNVSSITINSITYTSTSWPVNGVTVGTSSLTITIVPNVGTVSPTIKYVSIDNANFETATEASLILPLYIQLTGGEISLSAGTSSSTISYCGPTTPGQMYSKVDPAGGRGTILYQWEKSIDGSTWENKVGATSISYSPTLAVNETTYYRRKSYTSLDNAVYSNTITITINPLPTIDLQTINSLTLNSRSGTGTVTVDATASANATVDWYALSTGGSALSTGTSSNTAISFTTPSISTSTIYYAQARNLITSCLSSSRTPILAEIVGTLNAGVIGSDESVCGPSVPSILTSEIDATAGTSTVTYQWQSSANNVNFSNITGATDLTYQSGTISSTTYFRRIATATISGTVTSSSNVVTITINPLPALPVAVNKARTGIGSVDLSATSSSGITVDWYDDNLLTNVLATGSNNYTTPQLVDTTSYFAVARNISTGCESGTTEVIAIVNENFNGGTIDGPSSVCINGTPTIINSASLAHGGTPDLTGATLGTYNYQWEASTTSTSAGFSAITGATSITYQPGTLTTTTFYRRKVTTPNDPAVYSNVVAINVNALPVVATIANSSICAGSGIILTTTGANTYSWSPSTGLSATNVAAPTANPSTTTTYTVTGIDANGCSNTSSTTITVNALPTITLGSTSSVNSSATSFNLPYTATTGSPNKYSLSVTTPNALSGFTAVSNASLGSSPISVTIPASAVGVYNFNINVTNSSTGCVSPNVGFTQTITQAPPVSLSYTTPNVYTTGVTITSLIPSVTGSITSYTISPALPSGLSINGTTGVISGTPTVNTASTNYTVTGSNSGGSVTTVINLTVNGQTITTLSYNTPNVYTVGSSISNLTPSITGGSLTSYSISPNLPAGLTINTSTGVISGTPSAISTQTSYTVTATSSSGTVSTTVFITVNHAAPSALSYLTPNIYINGITITNLIPSVTGSVTSYTITPSLPTGLTINTSNGTISGTPTVNSPATNYTVTASNSGGSVTTVVNISVVDPAPSNLTYNSPNVYTTGVTITDLTPSITGTVTSYTISPALPSGLIIDGSSGVISGTPNGTSTKTTYTVNASNATGSVTTTLIITVIDNEVVQPQGGIKAVDYNLLSTDTVKIKASVSTGASPFTFIIKNSLNTNVDTIKNLLNGAIIKFKPISSNVLYTLLKIIDSNGVVRSSSFTKDTTSIKILKPNIALTLKAEAAVKQPDNSFKTTLSLKIKNSGEIDLGNVQVNANLSEVFPKGINYKLDSIRVVKGNFLINPNYTGAGVAKSPSSVTPGFSSIIGVKSNTVLDANYLFSNGVNLAINEEGQVLYYVSIAPTVEAITLKLQFTSSGDGQLVKSDGTVSQQNKTALSDDGTNIVTHPNITNSGTPAPTYLPLFPIEKIGTSLNIGQATPVTGGYTFPFELKVKNFGNLNLDSIQIIQSFANTFISPENATIVGTITSTSNLTINTSFNGYADSLLVNFKGKLIPGDSALINYTLKVVTNKTSATWLNQFSASGRSSIDYVIVTDTSVSGINPDPNNDGDPIESGYSRFYINFEPPLPPVVNNAVYTYNTNYPTSISGLVKSYPIGTVPVWCNSITSICQTNAPNTPTIIGKYVYQLRSYDTTSKLYSVNYVNDTIVIKPPVPIVIDSIYLIGNKSNPLNVNIQVNGLTGSSFIYYLKGAKLNSVPTLSSTAGVIAYSVSQSVNQVESDTVSFKVTMLNGTEVIHIQKKSSEAILQSNSTFNMSFEFVVTNLMNKQLDSVIITDNLLNSITAPSTFNVISLSSTGGLIKNSSFNGSTDFTLTTGQSSLKPLAVDTIRLNLNISPFGISGKLYNTAFANAKSPYGKVQVASTSTNPIGETIKQPTLFTIPELAINIPEGFSPNRDGVNDKFVIIKPFGTILELEVFNRWGNVVYTNSNYNNEWDGKGTNNFLGQDLVDGGYYYSLKATDKNGAVQIFKGFVLIQR